MTNVLPPLHEGHAPITLQQAFREAIVDTVRNHFKKKYESQDIRTSIIAAISVRVEEPVFESQTKTKLGSLNIAPEGVHCLAGTEHPRHFAELRTHIVHLFQLGKLGHLGDKLFIFQGSRGILILQLRHQQGQEIVLIHLLLDLTTTNLVFLVGQIDLLFNRCPFLLAHFGVQGHGVGHVLIQSCSFYLHFPVLPWLVHTTRFI